MRLQSFHVDGFGILRDTGIDPLPPGLSVILGDNGAGKSTLLEFLRALLFGFRDGRSGRPKYEPIRGGVHGGVAEVEMADGHPYRVVRRPGGALGLETVAARSDIAPARDLASMLGGATRDVFENVFAFSLAELQEVGTLDQEALKARLYAAGAGTGARSLPRVRADVEKEAKAFLSRASGSGLPAVADRIKALCGEQEALSRAVETFAELQARRVRLTEELAGADEAERGAAVALASRQAVLEAWADWSELLRRRKAVADLGDVPPAPEGAEERLKSAKQAVVERRRHADACTERLRVAEGELAAACARLGERSAGVPPATGYAEPWTEARVVAFDAGEAVEAQVAEMSGAMAERARDVAKAEAAASHGEDALKQASSNRSALEAEERQRWPVPPRSMDSIETDLSTLREARATATRLSEERAGRSTLEARRQGAEDDLKRLRVAPEPVAQPAHIPLFVAIGALAGSAALISFSPLAAGALFALFVVASAVAIRLHRKARSIVRAQRQEEIKDAEGRLKDVDDRLAAADEAIAKQQTALTELGKILGLKAVHDASDLEPVESRLLAERDSARALAEFSERMRGARKAEAEAADALEACRRALAGITAARAEAVARWSDWLATRGMPSGIMPETALQFIEQIRAARGLASGRDARATEVAEATKRVTEAEQAVVAVIAEAGDADEETFLKHVAAWRALQEARASLAAMGERFVARAGSDDRGRELEAALSATDEATLQAEVAALREGHADARKQADRLRHMEGEIAAEMRALESDAKIEVVQRDLAEQASVAEDLIGRWAVRRLCLHLLDAARRKFEEERQPAVIRSAGDHLRGVTGGAYARLLRRLDSDELEAETEGGELKRRQAWNRGLLEQIYLCLRLGFIEDYCTGAEPLPVVMDDVFANFDPHHARRAADLIAAFAARQQVIYMTCHPETVDYFRAAGAPGAGYYTLRDGMLAPTT
ncbi:MAG: hypothetical protein FJX72_00125 [Armatimonadetes bacterium]|nr:hypothetical protein [Armatimonadota bacterium]